MPGNIGLTVGGTQVIRPSVFTQINASAMVPVSSGAPQIAGLIGAFDGGAPNTVLAFTSFAQAQATLRNGQALSFLARIFNPGGGNGGASTVYVVRAGAPTQATIAGTCGLTFTSRDSGSHTNGIAVTVATGTIAPMAVTVTKAADGYSKTYNVGNALTVTSSGSTPKLIFDHVNLVATITQGGSTVATLPYPTTGICIAQLVPWINAVPGWTAAIATGADPSMPVVYMDNPAGGFTVTSSATAITASQGMAAYEITNNDPMVTAIVTSTTLNASITAMAMTSLAGAIGNSTMALALTDWNTALTVMDTVDVAGLFMAWTNTSAATLAQVQNAAYNDCITQRTITRKRYRILYTGNAPAGGATELANTNATAANAPILAGPVVYAWNGSSCLNPITGITEQLGSLGTAAQLCGLAMGNGPAQSITGNFIQSYGLEYPNPSDADINTLLVAGITPIVTDPVTGNAQVVQGLTTYQGGTNVSFRTLTGLRVQDAICRMFNSTLSQYVGYPLDLTTGQLIQASAQKALDNAILSAQNTSGFLTPGMVNGTIVPAWSNLVVTTDGLQTWSITVQAHPVSESDYISVTVNLTPVPIAL